jgi:hypothetical protein
MLNFFSTTQVFLDKLSSFTSGYSLLNFLAALVMAFISFPIFIYQLTSKEDLLDYITLLSKLKIKIKIYCTFYLILYALVTGFLAAALIEFQFRSRNIPTAIIYGVLGPFIIRKQLLTIVKSGIGEGATQEIADTIEKLNKEIASQLNDAEIDLKNLTKPAKKE